MSKFKALIFGAFACVASVSVAHADIFGVLGPFKRQGTTTYIDNRNVEFRRPATLMVIKSSFVVTAECANSTHDGRVLYHSSGTTGKRWYICEGDSPGWTLQGDGIGAAGDAALQIALGGVQVTSPTASINFTLAHFKATESPANTANISLSTSVLFVSSINTFAELQAIVADQTLVHTASSPTWTGGHTFSGWMVFSGSITATNAANTFGGDGSALVNLTAANISAGSLGSGVIGSSVAINAVGIAQLSASGTPDATTFLRGDNTWATPSGSGETNTASNQGAGGVPVFIQKTGVDLEFRSVNAGSNKVTVSTDAPNKEIDVDVDETNFTRFVTTGTNETISGNKVFTGTITFSESNLLNLYASGADFVFKSTAGNIIFEPGNNIVMGDAGVTNGIISTPENFIFNIDSNNNFTGNCFSVRHDGSGLTPSSLELFGICENGWMEVNRGAEGGLAQFHMMDEVSSTNTLTSQFYMTLNSAGTPGVGFGNAYTFELETSPGNREAVAHVAARLLDPTASSEDSELIFLTQTAGAAANTKFRIGPSTNTSEQKLLVNGNVITTGTYTGDGGPLTNLTPGNIAAGVMDPDVIASSIAVAKVGIAQLSASGSPSSANFLRGDNTWAAPAGGGDAVLAGTQTWTGGNTFNSWTTFNGSVTATNAANTFGGNGAALTSLTAANISAGTLGALVRASSVSANSVGSLQITNDSVDFPDITHTITLAGNPALAAGQCHPGTNGIVCEGSGADTIETLIDIVNPTSTDKTITFPNATGGVVVINSNGFPARTAANTYAARSITSGSTKISISNGNGVSGNPVLDIGNVDHGAFTYAAGVASLDANTVGSTEISNDSIVNADVNSSAAVAYSKLNLTNSIVENDLVASLAFDDGDLLDLSGISINGTAEGVRLPGHATDCSSAGTSEGQVCWEADADDLWVGTGSGVKKISATGGTPGGSNLQLQWNNSGAFAGTDNITWNDAEDILNLFKAQISSAVLMGGSTYYVPTSSGPPDSVLHSSNIANGKIQLYWKKIVSGGGGTGFLNLFHQQGKIYSDFIAIPAEINNSTNTYRVLFDASQTESILWKFIVPPTYSSGLNLELFYSMVSATSGKVDMEADMMCVSDGDAQKVNVASFDTINEITGGTTVPATTDHPDRITLVMTNADSIATYDECIVRVHRDHDDADDTATGDLSLNGLLLRWTE